MKVNSSEALVVFVKNSKPGSVKTRLAKAVGNQKALDIYERLLSHTAVVAHGSKVTVCTYYSDYVPGHDMWDHVAHRKQVQVKGDLGRRMRDAFETKCKDYEKVVLIGSDCGELTENIVRQAFRALDRTEYVLGPTRDGGYYLIGMRSSEPRLFEGIEWSTEYVFARTVGHILTLGQNFSILKQLNDVDTIEDWNELGW